MSQVALVTGAARGIGRGIAVKLAANGFDVAIVYVAADDAAQDAVSACVAQGQRAIAIKANIGDTDNRQRIIETIKNEFGRLDVLVNNAGVAPKERADVLSASEDSYDWVMNINLKGPTFLTQLAANWMIEQRQRDETIEPKIINISSISAYTSSPNRGEYCISKSGMSMLTLLYADRLAEYGINVYEVRPGIIKTDMTAKVTEKYDKLIANGLYPIRRWGTPEDIAKAVVAIADGALPFSTGEVINVDGGFHMKRL